MKKKNAFTLVELLAVIIILGIILLIVVPSALNTINNAGKNTFASSAKKLIDISKTYIMANDISLPDQNTYIAISIADLDFENAETYGTTGGVIVVNYGTLVDPDYDYYVYLSNSDFVINGAIKSKISSNIKNKGTTIPYTAITLPSINSILIYKTLGITGNVLNVTVPDSNYVEYAPY